MAIVASCFLFWLHSLFTIHGIRICIFCLLFGHCDFTYCNKNFNLKMFTTFHRELSECAHLCFMSTTSVVWWLSTLDCCRCARFKSQQRKYGNLKHVIFLTNFLLHCVGTSCIRRRAPVFLLILLLHLIIWMSWRPYVLPHRLNIIVIKYQ